MAYSVVHKIRTRNILTKSERYVTISRMKSLIAACLLALTCTAQPAPTGCRQSDINPRIAVCQEAPQKHRECRGYGNNPIRYRCHSYTVHPKHYYGPVSQSRYAKLTEGDSYTVTELDEPVGYSQQISTPTHPRTHCADGRTVTDTQECAEK
jgi:hypothetical protein